MALDFLVHGLAHLVHLVDVERAHLQETSHILFFHTVALGEMGIERRQLTVELRELPIRIGQLPIDRREFLVALVQLVVGNGQLLALTADKQQRGKHKEGKGADAA